MSLSDFVETHLPCPHCDSSDAYSKREDGGGKCFSCGQFDPPEDQDRVEVLSAALGPHTIQYIPWRGLSRETLRFFDITAVCLGDQPDYMQFPWPNGQVQCRKYDSHTFWVHGTKRQKSDPQLFGTDRFSAGSAKAVTLCEGVSDALAVYEMLGSQYPVLAVRSASSAKSDVQSQWEYVNSFDRIYLCFDSDPQGKKALGEVAALFDIRKVHHVKLTKKDAKEYHDANDWKTFRNIWYNARKFVPDGLLSTYEEIEEALSQTQLEPLCVYPWQSINDKLDGIREGECVLITGMEGLGKTEILGAIEHQWLKETEHNLGIIHAEEKPHRTVGRLVNYHTGGIQTDTEYIFKQYKELTGHENRAVIYHPGGVDDPQTLLDNIRLMVVAFDCKLVCFDHITMLGTGLEIEKDERRTLDWFSTRLRYLLDELNFSLILVSHVNDQGGTRGSANISKIANTRIDIDRNLLAENDIERNTTSVVVSKARETGRTGPAGALFFDEILRETSQHELEIP